MRKRVILIPKDDLVYYPPTISLINVFINLGVEVVCVGEYSDIERKRAFENKGVRFVPIHRVIKDVSRIRIINWIVILKRLFDYKRKIKEFFKTEQITNEDLIWFIYSSTIAHIQKYIEKYPYVVQFYEFENYSLNGKARMLHPSYDVNRFLNKAKALIHCEYNRAVITNGLYGLDKTFFVLPNKPFESEEKEKLLLPEDVNSIIDRVKKITSGKTIVLYQGIFNSSERRLDEFCEAMALLPDNYCLIAMGRGGTYYDDIKKKYESDKILFIPFIRPPYHLQITQLANIGILTYHPANKTYVGVINPLYCAPNKIFEYGKYGISMIANDVPGLKMIFDEYHCGKTISSPITPRKVADCIMAIERNSEEMSRGARKYYESIDIEAIVKEILLQVNFSK